MLWIPHIITSQRRKACVRMYIAEQLLIEKLKTTKPRDTRSLSEAGISAMVCALSGANRTAEVNSWATNYHERFAEIGSTKELCHRRVARSS